MHYWNLLVRVGRAVWRTVHFYMLLWGLQPSGLVTDLLPNLLAHSALQTNPAVQNGNATVVPLPTVVQLAPVWRPEKLTVNAKPLICRYTDIDYVPPAQRNLNTTTADTPIQRRPRKPDAVNDALNGPIYVLCAFCLYVLLVWKSETREEPPKVLGYYKRRNPRSALVRR